MSAIMNTLLQTVTYVASVGAVVFFVLSIREWRKMNKNSRRRR